MRFLSKLTLVFLGLWLTCQGAFAFDVQGQVVAVLGGDSLRIRDDRHVQYTVRLVGIDAPEKFQHHGQDAEDTLREQVFRYYVQVEWLGRSGSPRIGKVTYQGRDISLEQIRRGSAWFSSGRASGLSQDVRDAYAAAEADAKLRRVGLWREPKPIPPWEFRAGRRK